MGWLSNLLDSFSKPPRYGGDAEEPPRIDWKGIESKLVVLAERELNAFAPRHAGETFYGFGFDCNAEEGQVLLCLNTRAGQIAAAKASMARFPQLYTGKALEDVASGIEWGFGDWKYQGFNTDLKRWQKDWSDVEAQVVNAGNIFLSARRHKELETLREAFMVMASRALLELSRSGVFSSLERDSDFRVLCADHDEGPEEGFRRLELISKSGT